VNVKFSRDSAPCVSYWRLRLSRYTERTGKITNTYKCVFRKYFRKLSLVRQRWRWNCEMKINVTYVVMMVN